MTTPEEIEARLKDNGLTIEDRKVLPLGQIQIWPTNMDACVNVWTTTGTCTVQGGEDSSRLSELLGELVGKGKGKKSRRVIPGSGPHVPPRTRVPARPKPVFVVYGHDEHAKTQLEAMLRRWGCEPLILDQLPSEGATVIEKLHSYQTDIGFGIVLATPDDPSTSEGLFRARQNVVLELGMLLTKLGRSRVAILLKNPVSMERPSDIDGLIYIPFTDDVSETKVQLAKEMDTAGYEIRVDRL